MAVDGEGFSYLKSTRVRLVRYGDEVVPGAECPVKVRKCSAEAGLVRLGSGIEVKLETGGERGRAAGGAALLLGRQVSAGLARG